VVLYAVANTPQEDDPEVGAFELAPITRSGQAAAYRIQIDQHWNEFLDALEGKLVAVGRTRPTVTTEDVIVVRDAIYAVANEALPRVVRRVAADPALAHELKGEAARSFNFPAALQDKYPDVFREELTQMLRFGTFVVAQKLILYRVLEDAGPRRETPFRLDQLDVSASSTDPRAIKSVLDQAFSLAIRRSKDWGEQI
jgi:hypothetical protein